MSNIRWSLAPVSNLSRPVDEYVMEGHFEDCRVPQDACSVDYAEQYIGDNPKPVYEEDDYVIR